MASIAGIPINSSQSQFDLIKDPVKAFNDTARFVELTRGVPIVNELATRAEVAALRQQQQQQQQQPTQPILVSNVLAPMASASTQQSLQPFSAHILAPNTPVPATPSLAIANQPIQLGADARRKEREEEQDRDDDDGKDSETERARNLPPGLSKKMRRKKGKKHSKGAHKNRGRGKH